MVTYTIAVFALGSSLPVRPQPRRALRTAPPLCGAAKPGLSHVHARPQLLNRTLVFSQRETLKNDYLVLSSVTWAPVVVRQRAALATKEMACR